ncbi:hypothetical protein B0T09DRAFT_324652 [Sordaria sp. MPI-SDFR-AT-0083]|nr:hypothetical protein B0T09DRAFT_324652 [Sordaria sp. MPI-SDFR-AT-0083]
MPCDLPTKAARSRKGQNASLKETWGRDEELQNTPENDPRRFYAAVEEASDNGELPLERCVTAMSLESQEPTTPTNSNTETLSHIAAVYTRDTDAKKNIYPSISNVTSGISKSNTCSTCNKQNESCSARSYTPYSHTFQRGNHLRARRQDHKHRNKLRAIVSPIPHALEECLAAFKETCKEEKRGAWEALKKVHERPRRRRSLSRTPKYTASTYPTSTNTPPVFEAYNAVFYMPFLL